MEVNAWIPSPPTWQQRGSVSYPSPPPLPPQPSPHLPHGSREAQLLPGEVGQLLWSIVLLQVREPPEPPDPPGDVIIQVVGTGKEEDGIEGGEREG